MVLLTVGHGQRSVDELAGVLVDAGVGRLVDVRRYPGSQRHPHLAGEKLAATLPERGVEYQWWGEELGGRRRASGPVSRHPAWRNPAFRAYADHMDLPAFRDTLVRLLALGAAGPPLAVMCAETLWWRCHRRLIADAASLRGAHVVHLLELGKSQPHVRHPALRADGDGWPVYDLGVDRSML